MINYLDSILKNLLPLKNKTKIFPLYFGADSRLSISLLRVFFILRQVSLAAGLGCQHSHMRRVITLRYCGEHNLCKKFCNKDIKKQDIHIHKHGEV